MKKENKKINLIILCGGRSGEHEVSLQSALSIYVNIDKEKYNVRLVGITKDGHWVISRDLVRNFNDHNNIHLDPKAREVITTTRNDKAYLKYLDEEDVIMPMDVVFPIIHGTYGEDGSLQGFLELLNVAYVGAGVLGSAVGMDKDVMKRLLRDAGLPIGEFLTLKSYQINENSLKKVVEKLSFPIFIKPANLGSSVGVNKAKDYEQLSHYADKAMKYDAKVIFEKYIEGEEIECSVLGASEPKTSVPGRIIPQHEFYSYEAKYLDNNGALTEIPAKLSPEKVEEVQDLAIKVFQTLECYGLARVDFFLTKQGTVIINEINTLPGFTSISMYPKLWEASGLPYFQLLDRLVELALERKSQNDKLKRTYS